MSTKESSTMRVRMGTTDVGKLEAFKVIELPTKVAKALLSHRCCYPVTVPASDYYPTDIVVTQENIDSYAIPAAYLKRVK